ncbi:hypothetical protein CPB83DRAFT_890098 [Crepidotus variabilis]|uniref:HMG box domain-containing protein n=1 Tax=Crepidotus variabilis TaxID=179855 RepID=A0A9P6ERB4_9AGAR|nr:hypothetical protein CPB83DRAFT_890098 [Crepidotus variabilis]
MSFSRVHGWTATPDDFQKARVSFLASQNPTFHISDPPPPINGQGFILEGLDFSCPASSSAILSEANSSTEQTVDAEDQHIEPNWVARPRNEFILFRCEFVRQHSGEAKRLNYPSSQDPEKTLSKQAAEAWHCLSSEERMYWKEKANYERTEHARRYPEYRYRPRKNLGHKRSARSLSIQPPNSDFSLAGSRTCISPTQQPPQLRALNNSSGVPSPPMGRRRALSVPGFTTAPQRSIHNELVELSPPSSAPPHKVSFESDGYQLPIARPPTLNRYRSTPIMGPVDTINSKRTESKMTTTQPYYSLQPEWNTSSHSSLLTLSSLSLMDDPNLASGGDLLDLTFLGYQPNEGEMWLPQLYSSPTGSSSGAFLPSTPMSQDIADSFTFEEPMEPLDGQITGHEQSGVGTSNQQLLFSGEVNNFFCSEF